MADSRESVSHMELTEEEVAKLAQQIPGSTVTSSASMKESESTKKMLTAIGSESEQSRITSSKVGTNIPSATHAAKQYRHDPNNILQDNVNITPDLVCSISCSGQGNEDISAGTQQKEEGHDNLNSTTCPTPCDSISGQMNVGSHNSTTDNVNTNGNQAKGKLTDMVPECMYSVLQQRAQNVLKMIAEKKLSESAVPLNPRERGSHPNNQNLSSNLSPRQSTEIQKQSNESAHSKGSKTSSHSIKDLADRNNSVQLSEQNELQKKNIIENTILPRESQQSTRSTEQCTTDYVVKNKIDGVTGQKTASENRSSEKATKNSTENVDTQKVNEVLQQVFSEHSTQAVFKELSQIIQSNDVPDKLTKRGEIICYFFKQKLINSLQAAGNLDIKSAELVNVTASKFAKWMEDILHEIDDRKKKTQSNDAKAFKEDTDEDVFVSATSSKESFSQREYTSNLQREEIEEKPELVKIQEISDSELNEKYGLYLADETKHEVFNFIGPDQRSVEVKHLLTDNSNAKIMVVKKETTESKSSTWVVEVGPDVTLERVSGSLSKNVIKEESENESITLMEGGWNLEKIGWENWLPKVLAQTKTCRRTIPILKKQCMLRESDNYIEYPNYSPSLLALGTEEISVFDASNIEFPTPPQTEPSAPQES